MPVDTALSVLATVLESGRSWPRPSCPQCGTGYIGFATPTTDESHESAQLHGHDFFDPDWIKGTFVVRGQCENPDCQLAVHGTGDFYVDLSSEQEDFDSRGPNYSEYYKLMHLHPAVQIMSIPKTAPKEVHEGVSRASRVLFADPGLAATALRATVERFLTTAGIPGTTNGAFTPADTRIKQWAAQDPTRETTADLLLAVKWLGNAGTHEDADLTTTEVLQGASMLDEAFHRIYTGPDIDAHARNINAAKGPHRQP